MGHFRLTLLAPCALLCAAALGCADEDDTLAGDYSACGSAVLAAQEDVCDDLLTGVVRLCGFDLTVDPCACTDEAEGCTEDAAWLESILDCRSGASECAQYIACLEAVGTSPSGCTSPASWDCIVPAAGASGR
jgi:hypothetical protein